MAYNRAKRHGAAGARGGRPSWASGAVAAGSVNHLLGNRGRGAGGRLRPIVLAALAVLLGGCTPTYVERAQVDYSEGRYLEVAEELAERERELERLPPPLQAEYGIYRGLALLRLGDYPEARRWMRYAYDVERSAPGTLVGPVRAQLDYGWKWLERRRGAATESSLVAAPSPRRSADDAPAAGPASNLDAPSSYR
jgi:hypothetical protein